MLAQLDFSQGSINEAQKTVSRFLSTLPGEFCAYTPLNTLGVVIGAAIRGSSIGNEAAAIFTGNFLLTLLMLIIDCCFKERPFYNQAGEEVLIQPGPAWRLFTLGLSIALTAISGTLITQGYSDNTTQLAETTAIDTAIGVSLLITVSTTAFFCFRRPRLATNYEAEAMTVDNTSLDIEAQPARHAHTVIANWATFASRLPPRERLSASASNPLAHITTILP